MTTREMETTDGGFLLTATIILGAAVAIAAIDYALYQYSK